MNGSVEFSSLFLTNFVVDTCSNIDDARKNGNWLFIDRKWLGAAKISSAEKNTIYSLAMEYIMSDERLKQISQEINNSVHNFYTSELSVHQFSRSTLVNTPLAHLQGSILSSLTTSYNLQYTRIVDAGGAIQVVTKNKTHNVTIFDFCEYYKHFSKCVISLILAMYDNVMVNSTVNYFKSRINDTSSRADFAELMNNSIYNVMIPKRLLLVHFEQVAWFIGNSTSLDNHWRKYYDRKTRLCVLNSFVVNPLQFVYHSNQFTMFGRVPTDTEITELLRLKDVVNITGKRDRGGSIGIIEYDVDDFDMDFDALLDDVSISDLPCDTVSVPAIVNEPVSIGVRQNEYDLYSQLRDQYVNSSKKIAWLSGFEYIFKCYADTSMNVMSNKRQTRTFCRICDRSVGCSNGNYDAHLKSCHEVLYNVIIVNKFVRDSSTVLKFVPVSDESVLNHILVNVPCGCKVCVLNK